MQGASCPDGRPDAVGRNRRPCARVDRQLATGKGLDMPQRDSGIRHVGRAGWFAVGALAASLAFAALTVASDYFQAIGDEQQAEAPTPSVIIEAR